MWQVRLMENSYVPAAGVQATHLSANTPLGLFRAIRGDHEIHTFIVADFRGDRYALKLGHGRGGGGRLWLCSDDTSSWRGLSLGPVELELDLSSVVEGHAEIREVNITAAGPGIRVIHGSLAVDLLLEPAAASSSDDDPVFAVPRWRLIQRRGPEDVEVVYEHGTTTAS